jgi:hypothetical protein
MLVLLCLSFCSFLWLALKVGNASSPSTSEWIQCLLYALSSLFYGPVSFSWFKCINCDSYSLSVHVAVSYLLKNILYELWVSKMFTQWKFSPHTNNFGLSLAKWEH